jgi:hypothetical protein
MLSKNIKTRETTGAFALVDSLVDMELNTFSATQVELYYLFMTSCMHGKKKDLLNIY